MDGGSAESKKAATLEKLDYIPDNELRNNMMKSNDKERMKELFVKCHKILSRHGLNGGYYRKPEFFCGSP